MSAKRKRASVATGDGRCEALTRDGTRCQRRATHRFHVRSNEPALDGRSVRVCAQHDESLVHRRELGGVHVVELLAEWGYQRAPHAPGATDPELTVTPDVDPATGLERVRSTQPSPPMPVDDL